MKYPSNWIKEIGELVCCIRGIWDLIVDHITPATVQEDQIEHGAGAGSVLAGWISVTLINQGDTSVTITSGSGAVLLPGTTIRWDLKGFANTGDQIDFTVAAGTEPSLIVVEVR